MVHIIIAMLLVATPCIAQELTADQKALIDAKTENLAYQLYILKAKADMEKLNKEIEELKNNIETITTNTVISSDDTTNTVISSNDTTTSVL